MHRSQFQLAGLVLSVLALSSASVLLSLMTSSIVVSEPEGSLSPGWIAGRAVDLSPQDDYNPSLAVDSAGTMYVAFERADTSTRKTSIVVSTSVDGGLSWSVLTIISDAAYSVANPSLAVDVFSSRNDIFVAFELTKAANDHDVRVARRVSGAWSFLTISPSGAVRDDRFPKVAADASNGVVHIVWEYLASRDDIDLVYSKTTNRGVGWLSPVVLRGQVSDFNVYTQLTLAARQNNVYVAYRRAADSSSTTGDIDLSFGFSGANPSAFVSNVDGGEPNPTRPSVATTDGTLVMVAFETAYSPSDRDIH